MSRARKVFLGLCGLCLIGIGGVGLSSAAFSAQKANPANTFTAATSFCTSPGLQTVTANRDTFVSESGGTQTGTTTSMRVTSRNSNRNERSLVGFTLPTKPTGCSVTLATLKLSDSTSDTGRPINVFQISPSATWSETAVTWSTQPATTGSAATSNSVNGLQSWTLTSQVQAMYGSANPDNGFLIKDATESQASSARTQIYTTREAASNKPTLEVTFG